MNKLTKVNLALLAVLAVFVGVLQTVYAQDVSVAITSQQSLIVIVLGTVAGFIVAYQGYRTAHQDWDTLKFFDGVIVNVITSISLAMTAAVAQTELTIFGYVTVFFAGIGLAYQINQARKPTIPSNDDSVVV